MSDDDYDHLYNIVLVGNEGCGKTHLLHRYIKGTLPKTPASTVGGEFATRTLPLSDGRRAKCQFWDTAGQKRYRSNTTGHFHRFVGALVIYDVTNRSAFDSCAQWVEELRHGLANPSEIVIMLVGNKLDLADKSPYAREIPYDVGSEFASQHGLCFAEASAVENHNVKFLFEMLVQEIYIKSAACPTLTLNIQHISETLLVLTLSNTGGAQVTSFEFDLEIDSLSTFWSAVKESTHHDGTIRLLQHDGTPIADDAVLSNFLGCCIGAPASLAVAAKQITNGEEDEFEIKLDRRGGAPLGIDIDNTDGLTLRIDHIDRGLVSAWNGTCLPEQIIQVGDDIVEINGIRSDAFQLVEECRKHQVLTMKIRPQTAEAKNDGCNTLTDIGTDGSLTVTQTRADGSVNKTENRKDGSQIVREIGADGSQTVVHTRHDGFVTKTENKKDGSHIVTESGVDGSKTVRENRTDGSHIVVQIRHDGFVTKTETKKDGTQIVAESEVDGSMIVRENQVDGSQTVTQTRPDSSVTKTETKKDGSQIVTEIGIDGSQAVTLTWPDGSLTETEHKVDGSQIVTLIGADGSVTMTENNVDGSQVSMKK